jgi:hypothetical protein
LDLGIGWQFELVRDVIVEQLKACTKDIFIRREVHLVPFKEARSDFYRSGRCKGWQCADITKIASYWEGGHLDQCIHGWVHDKAGPSMDGTLGAWELLQRFNRVPVQRTKTYEVWAGRSRGWIFQETFDLWERYESIHSRSK